MSQLSSSGKLSKIWHSTPHMGNMEAAYVSDAFATNWIAPLGPHVDALEQLLAGYCKIPHVAALSSGTSALHLALILLGVKSGDEVICQSLTFSASANPIVYQGAVPVFIDSEPSTWNMDPVALRSAITSRLALGKKIKAIIYVHLYGMPAMVNEIQAVANEFDIPLIEDAAEALGARYNNQPCGSMGAFSILSFNGNKIITTSGGGALLSSDQAAIAKARFLATQARDPAPHYEHSEIGYNYRMSNVCAAIGRGQMEVLDLRVAARRANFELYRSRLGALSGISWQEGLSAGFSNRWLTTILVDPAKTGGITRETIRLAMEAENIECRPIWKPMHLQPVFAEVPFYGSDVAENLFSHGLCLPSGSNLTDVEFDRIFAVFDRLFSG